MTPGSSVPLIPELVSLIAASMRDNVLSLEAVLRPGEIIRTGRRAKRSSVGQDLAWLFIGSESTPGIIDELTLTLHGISEAMSAVRCTFPSVAAGCQAVNTAIQMGESVVRIELLDADCMAATNAYSKADPPPNLRLLLEFHGSESELVAQAITFREIADQFGLSGLLMEIESRGTHPSLAGAPSRDAIGTDVCMPISNHAESVKRLQEEYCRLGLQS